MSVKVEYVWVLEIFVLYRWFGNKQTNKQTNKKNTHKKERKKRKRKRDNTFTFRVFIPKLWVAKSRIMQNPKSKWKPVLDYFLILGDFSVTRLLGINYQSIYDYLHFSKYLRSIYLVAIKTWIFLRNFLGSLTIKKLHSLTGTFF